MKHFCSFSEAIRAGAAIRPQSFTNLIADGASCAIGAGLEAMGIGGVFSTLSAIFQIREQFPYINNSANCPAKDCNYTDADISRVIVHLNDGHYWTREAIADWLESEEEKLGFVTLIENPAEVTTQEKALVTV